MQNFASDTSVEISNETIIVTIPRQDSYSDGNTFYVSIPEE